MLSAPCKRPVRPRAAVAARPPALREGSPCARRCTAGCKPTPPAAKSQATAAPAPRPCTSACFRCITQISQMQARNKAGAHAGRQAPVHPAISSPPSSAAATAAASSASMSMPPPPPPASLAPPPPPVAPDGASPVSAVPVKPRSASRGRRAPAGGVGAGRAQPGGGLLGHLSDKAWRAGRGCRSAGCLLKNPNNSTARTFGVHGEERGEVGGVVLPAVHLAEGRGRGAQRTTQWRSAVSWQQVGDLAQSMIWLQARCKARPGCGLSCQTAAPLQCTASPAYHPDLVPREHLALRQRGAVPPVQRRAPAGVESFGIAR